MAWERLGWKCAALAEIEPFPCAVLKHHYPTVPNLGNVEEITEGQIEKLGQVGCVIFGFPCQDVSVAGQRKGLNNADGTITRSGLFFTAVKISEWSKARYVVVENVPGLFSSNEGRDFASVVGELAGIEFDVPGEGWRNTGVALGPKGLVEWSVLDAQWFGLAQRRKRVFLILDTGDWRNRPPILLERESLSGNSPPRRETGEGTAPPIAGCSNGGGANGPGRTADDAEVLICARSLRAQAQSSHREDTDNFVCATITKNYATHRGRTAGKNGGVAKNQLVTHSLKAEGFDAFEDGTGRGVPLVPTVISSGQGNAERVSDGEPSLTCLHEAPILFQPMAFDTTQITSLGNYSAPKPGGPSHPLASAQHPPDIAIQDIGKLAGVREQNGSSIAEPGAPMFTLQSGSQHGVVAPDAPLIFKPCFTRTKKSSGNPEKVCHTLSHSPKQGDTSPHTVQGMAVRRLTPRERERLQGFPDDYTAITFRGKPAADGPRYKAIGNSMAVPVIEWIGCRMDLVDELVPFTVDTLPPSA